MNWLEFSLFEKSNLRFSREIRFFKTKTVHPDPSSLMSKFCSFFEQYHKKFSLNAKATIFQKIAENFFFNENLICRILNVSNIAKSTLQPLIKLRANYSTVLVFAEKLITSRKTEENVHSRKS